MRFCDFSWKWLGTKGITRHYRQRVVMPYGWGVKAGVVCVWVAGKSVWSPCYTRAISERFIGAARQSAIKIHVYFTLLYFTKWRIYWKYMGNQKSKMADRKLEMSCRLALFYGQNFNIMSRVLHHLKHGFINFTHVFEVVEFSGVNG